MSLGDVRTFEKVDGNTVVIRLGLWAERQGKWIQIHMTGPNDLDTTVTNNPDSVRYHPAIYHDLRRALVDQGCWAYGHEEMGVDGALREIASTTSFTNGESPNHDTVADKGRPRYQAIRLRGDGPSASEIVIADRRSSRF